MGTNKIRVVEIEGFLIEVEDEELTLMDDEEKANSDSDDELVGGFEKLIEIKETISKVCNYAREAFNDSAMPDEFSLEFGIKLAGEKGLPLVVKGKTEASLRIKATWKKGAEQ